MSLTTINGMVVITYGPQSVAGNYVVTATAINNLSVSTSQTVQFVSAAGTTASFTASPLTMASLDAQKDSLSTLMMKVVNVKGNPAPEENVSFSIVSSNSGIYNLSAQPYLQTQYQQTVASYTDQGGIATVQFFPGTFTTDVNNKNYSFTAVATAVVQARWGSVTKNLTLKYMNYPSLSVDTEVNPVTLAMNGTVNVTVSVSGDGYGLGQKPLDVVLLMDRSSSMLTNSTINGVKIGNHIGTLTSLSLNDKMVDAMTAASSFVNNSGNLDRFAVLSFGDNWYYGNYAKLYNQSCVGSKCLGQQNLDAYAYQAGRDYNCDEHTWCGGAYAGDNSNASSWYMADDVAYVNAHYYHNNVNVNTGKPYPATGVSFDSNGLTYDKSGVITAVNGIVPSGGTPTRRGIYEAVNTTINDPLIKTGNRGGTNTVKAIILLTDGAWNTGGDPEATNTTPPDPDGSTYSPVSLGDGVGTGSVITFASQNGIKIFPIGLGVTPNCSATLNRYAVATGGVYYFAPDSTQLATIYSSIAGNLRQAAGVNTTMLLSFTNVVVNNVSTPGNQAFNYLHINGSSTLVNSWNITQKPISSSYPYTIDSTNDWTNNNRNLSFNIGTIQLNQTWQATMSFQVLQAGNINVFGSGSKIHTDTSATDLLIPDTYITVTPGNSTINSSFATLQITNFTGPGTSTTSADMAWNLSYTAWVSSPKTS